MKGFCFALILLGNFLIVFGGWQMGTGPGLMASGAMVLFWAFLLAGLGPNEKKPIRPPELDTPTVTFPERHGVRRPSGMRSH